DFQAAAAEFTGVHGWSLLAVDRPDVGDPECDLASYDANEQRGMSGSVRAAIPAKLHPAPYVCASKSGQVELETRQRRDTDNTWRVHDAMFQVLSTPRPGKDMPFAVRQIHDPELTDAMTRV